MATMHEIARKAGVSIATAYRVFNKSGVTSKKTRLRVISAADELGYDYSENAGSPAEDRQSAVALVVANATNMFNAFLIDNLVRELHAQGHAAAVFYSQNDEELFRRHVRTVSEHAYSAMLFMPLSTEKNETILHMIQERYPVTQLYQTVYPELDTIMFDDERGTYSGIRHMLQCGHRRIAVITVNDIASSVYNARISGYRQALDEYDVPYDERFIWNWSYFSQTKIQLKERIREMRPTAILAVSEAVTAYTVQIIGELGLRLGYDISLVAYDDFPWVAAYGISAVEHPLPTVGDVAARLIHERITASQAGRTMQPRVLTFEPKLIARDSVRVL